MATLLVSCAASRSQPAPPGSRAPEAPAAQAPASQTPAAGAPAPPAAPSEQDSARGPVSPAPRDDTRPTLVDAVAQLALAAAKLDAAERDLASGGAPGRAASSSSTAQPTRPSKSAEKRKAEAHGVDASAGEVAHTPCDTACRALASMARAVDTLCGLTGPDDERCVAARRRLDESQRRLSVCSCTKPSPG